MTLRARGDRLLRGRAGRHLLVSAQQTTDTTSAPADCFDAAAPVLFGVASVADPSLALASDAVLGSKRDLHEPRALV
jgi:hypothetical protein